MKAPSSRELICVDLRGMKAALVAQARARDVSPSEFLRAALGDALTSGGWAAAVVPDDLSQAQEPRIRLSLRMSVEDRQAVLASARQARLTPGDYVAGLVAGVPVLTGGASRGDHLAALVASNAAMTTLARNLGQLTSLLRQGSAQVDKKYLAMPDKVALGVREHVQHVSAVLADLRPRRATTTTARSSGGQRV